LLDSLLQENQAPSWVIHSQVQSSLLGTLLNGFKSINCVLTLRSTEESMRCSLLRDMVSSLLMIQEVLLKLLRKWMARLMLETH